MAISPLRQALINEVSLFLFSLFTSALCSTKYFTMASFPFLHEIINGVLPSLSFLFTSALYSTK